MCLAEGELVEGEDLYVGQVRGHEARRERGLIEGLHRVPIQGVRVVDLLEGAGPGTARVHFLRAGS